MALCVSVKFLNLALNLGCPKQFQRQHLTLALVAKDKPRILSTSCIFQNGCLHVGEKCSSQKKREKCQLNPNRDSFVGGRRAFASSEQGFSSDVTKELKCSRWEEFAGKNS
jgi:hypothetical protein